MNFYSGVERRLGELGNRPKEDREEVDVLANILANTRTGRDGPAFAP